MKYPLEIFKAYDIRGIVATQLTPSVTEDIGKVLGTLALEAKVRGLVVGYDGRLTSLELSKKLIAGILSVGCDVFNIGLVTTPMVYFANYELGTLSGIMITGSHNPPEYNGLKMVINGETLAGEAIQNIYQRLINQEYVDGKVGQIQTIDIMEPYIKAVTTHIKLKRKISIVIDCGNGATGKVAPILYRRLGAQVLGLFCSIDGTFPNHHPDPSKVENLNDLVHALSHTTAEIGLAFDGDGDRLGVVTKNGNIIYPDRQMMLFSANILEKNPNAKIIYDVKSSKLLDTWIRKYGGIPIMCRTGHSFIKAKIKETNAMLAGEMSGHIFFNDKWIGADDGVYAGARLLEILSTVDDPSAILNALPNSVATPEINITVNEGEQHIIVQKLQKNAKFKNALNIITIDGLRVEYADGFGLVRASNTTPVLVLRFESATEDGLEVIKKQFRQILEKHVKQVNF